jgi:hypothetical protein
MSKKTETDALVRAAAIAQLDDTRRALLATERLADPRRLAGYGYRVHSQTDEDGILCEIFRRIGDGNRTFVELGASDGIENNTRFLLDQGWRGGWVEGSARKAEAARKRFADAVKEKRLAVALAYLTAKNVDETVKRVVPVSGSELDLLSIDLDGNDYYLLDAIRCVTPRVIVAEYNAKFPADVAWVMEYNEAHTWDGSDYFGASLKAFETLLAPRGYRLVGCGLAGTNGFFVREHLAKDPPFCAPFTAENHYEPVRYYLHPLYHAGHPAGFGPSCMVGGKKSSTS